MEKQKTSPDKILWIASSLLLLVTVFADHYFSEIAAGIRITGWLIVISVLVSILLRTTQGKSFWQFAKEARIEMYKVVWPTREETVRTTFLVAGLVLLAAFIVWGVDSLLLAVIGWFTG